MDESEEGKMKAGKTTVFDFDLWAKLAEVDPVEFERQREQAIFRFLGTLDSDQRVIEALHDRIESMRDRNAAPMENLQWLMSELAGTVEELKEQHAEQAQRVSGLLK
jgi:hypothetical protein